jgi:hypothetical protein
MIRQAAAAAVAVAAAAVPTVINVHLALLVQDALNQLSNVRKCRIIRVQRISMLRDPLWQILVSLECKWNNKK